MQALKTKQQESYSQFEITSDLLRNLYKFDLTPSTKLVLLELTTHLNESKNGSVVFPSVGYIAEVLGIGLTAAKKAINDLIKQGLIIKTKRNNVKGNYNKYLFTSKITSFKMTEMNIYSHEDKKVRNSAQKPSEMEYFKQSQNELFLIRTNKHEQINNKGVDIKSGGNVYNKGAKTSGTVTLSEEDLILRDYAIKHGARNIQAYINTLKSSNSANKIISEYKEKNYATKKALRSVEETQSLIKEYTKYMEKSCAPTQSFLEFGKKIKIKALHQ